MKIDHLPQNESTIVRTGEKLGLTRVISDPLGVKSAFVWQETLIPGRRSSSRHRHTRKEEMVIVLAGEIEVSHGDEVTVLKTGESYAFLPEDLRSHEMCNRGTVDAVFLGIASNFEGDEVIYG